MASPESHPPILFLGTQMEVAGAQRVLLSLARAFHARGYPVQAVFFYDKQGLVGDWQARNDFPVISLGAWKYGGFFLFNLLRLPFGLLRYLGSLGGVRVVIAFTPHSNVLGLLPAWLAGVPWRIATHHGLIEGSSKLLARFHGWLANVGVFSRVVAVSEQVREYAIREEYMDAGNITVIENGIEPLAVDKLGSTRRAELRAEIGVSQEGLLLLTSGRLTAKKGHAVLLDAIARLGNKGPGAVFAFAGDGPLRAALEAQAAELGIADRVRFLGLRRDVDELLLAADVFVQPSLWEGLSLAMLEALLSGAPVLATQVEGVVDVIEDGKTGLLVPPGDASVLATAILKLIEDAKLRRRLGKAGQAHVRAHYNVDRMADEYEALIQGLLKEEGARGG
jgi:glycosyltransferase involved in cell wall biosynthesis